jgi:hypothetical protein
MSNSSLLRLVESLRSRLDAGDEMIWERSPNQEFVLRIPSPAITLKLDEDATVDPSRVTVSAESTEIEAKDEDRLVIGEFLPDSPGYEDVTALLASAKQRFASIHDVLERGAAVLESDSGPIGAADATIRANGNGVDSEADKAEWAKVVTGVDQSADANSKESPVLSEPTDDQVQSFFQRIKGNWKRNHEQGFDELAIDELGDSYYRFTEQGVTVSLSPKPAFHLVLIACAPDLSKVEVAREASNGTARQIEVLRINDNEMIGHAKHDNQLLQYRRAP